MTLVEVLTATVILGVGITGLLSAATMSMRNQHRSESRMQALYLAQGKLGEIDLIGAHIYQVSRPMTGTSQAGDRSYSWSVRIEQQPVGELFAVQVSVSGEGPDGATSQLSTWLNDYDAKSLIPSQQKDKSSPSEANVPKAGGG
jgi:Tfp pilus assembly protein PilV